MNGSVEKGWVKMDGVRLLEAIGKMMDEKLEKMFDERLEEKLEKVADKYGIWFQYSSFLR